MPHVQCQHIIPALNAWIAREVYTTARLMATQFPGHGCMNDLTTEKKLSYIRKLGRVIDVLIVITCYPWVFVQPVTGKRPVDWCRK